MHCLDVLLHYKDNRHNKIWPVKPEIFTTWSFTEKKLITPDVGDKNTFQEFVCNEGRGPQGSFQREVSCHYFLKGRTVSIY